MKLSIYLHRYVVDTLRQFGTLEEVVDRILLHADNGDIDIFDKPKTVSRDGAGRYDINITNDNYLEVYALSAPNSPRISLRRLLYWFVDNEIYEDLGWVPVNDFQSVSKLRIKKEYDLILKHLERLSMLDKHFSEITKQFKELQNVL